MRYHSKAMHTSDPALTSPTSTSDLRRATQTEPVMPLDYGTPPLRPPGRTRDLVVGIVVSVVMALGVGFLTFGWMISSPNMSGRREMAATFTAVGACLLTLAVCLVGTIAWMRFARR